MEFSSDPVKLLSVKNEQKFVSKDNKRLKTTIIKNTLKWQKQQQQQKQKRHER